jgi:hypothetical protein
MRGTSLFQVDTLVRHQSVSGGVSFVSPTDPNENKSPILNMLRFSPHLA